MNTSFIKSQKLNPGLMNMNLSTEKITIPKSESHSFNSELLYKKAKKITLVENSFTFGYIKLKSKEKVSLRELTNQANTFHILSGTAIVDSKNILHKGSTLLVNNDNMNDYLEILSDNDLIMVWWDEVEEEDWFHSNMM